MKPRFILHMLLSASLISLGLWLYMQMQTSSHEYIDSIFVASYWFTFLIFLLFSWFFYWVLHKRSTTAWLISLVLAVAIAIAGIIALRIVSKQYQQEIEKAEEVIQQQNIEQSQIDTEDSTVDPGVAEEPELDEQVTTTDAN